MNVHAVYSLMKTEEEYSVMKTQALYSVMKTCCILCDEGTISCKPKQCIFCDEAACSVSGKTLATFSVMIYLV